MSRWLQVLVALLMVGFCLLLQGQAPSPYVTVTGTLQGPNGLPAKNDVISIKPTQTFFVANSGLSGNGYNPCQTGLGDGLNTIPPGTYLQSFCFNDSGFPLTISGIRCFTDNSGTSTLNLTDSASNALLTGPITCSSAFAAGTQSAHIVIPNGSWIEFIFIADGTSKQTTWTVTQ